MPSAYCLEMHMLCTCHLYCCYLYMYMSSTYYLGIYILCAHYLKWSLISSFLTDNTDAIRTSSLVLFIYSIMYNLVSAHCLHRCTLSMSFACCPHMYTSFAFHSFCTLSTHMHIVHVICMLSAHVHIICLSSLPFLIYLIIHNLVSAHCLHTCILSMSSVYCLEMHMSSTYYLGIYVLCAHYLQWSLISSFLTDNTNVIHTSSLVVFIYSIMENMSSAPLLDDVSSAPLPDDVSSTPLPDDMSSAHQRNMPYLFEV